MSQPARERILDMALDLFNRDGSANVTTNHIAAALFMSPGNLYYHYRNKAEIVRALFGRIMAAWATNYALPADEAPSIALMERMVAGNFAIQAQYRFFFRDLTLLLNADAELAASYRSNRDAGIANTRRLIEAFVAAGILRPFASAAELDDLSDLLWLVGDFWLVFRDSGGAPFDDADMARGIRLFHRLLSPHLSGHTP
jgi:AcrR family transcriptional regulator